MQLNQTTSPLVTSEHFTTSTIGMDESGMDKACAFLRDKIYTDKILATIRETITNAIDAHIKHGVTEPVKTGLRINQHGKIEFFVRDFARGLSDDELRNIFGMYFRSTKSGSNDFIGGFGLGAKAPSCYNDTFYVESNFEGTKTLYMFTLGANERGSSTVQILNIASEPTTESGLEVYIEVKSHYDSQTFENKIRNFVIVCNAPIEFTSFNNDVVFIPQVPKYTISKGRFNFKFYNLPYHFIPSPSSNNVTLSMGNVVYGTMDCSEFIRPTIDDLNIVVDIPIGVMSLPISREAFEENSANNRIKDEIRETLKSILDEDAAPFLNKTLVELINEKDSSSFTGNYFIHSKGKLYPNVWPFVSRLARANINITEKEVFKGKFLIALIPDKRTSNEWVSRLIDSAIEHKKSFYHIGENAWNQHATDEIKEIFSAKKVRHKIFLPDLGTRVRHDDVSEFLKHYNVKKPSSYSRRNRGDSMSALQVHNYARQKFDLPPADDADEAKDQIEEMFEDGFFNTQEKVNYFSITKSNCSESFWTAASQSLINSLIKLGWMERYDSKTRLLINDLVEKERQKNAIEQTIRTALPSFLTISHVTKLENRLRKNHKRASQITKIFNTIKTEHTPRGRFLRSFMSRSYYSEYDRLQRSDLRVMLKLK